MEILDQLEVVDALVAQVGGRGTLVGVDKRLKEVNPKLLWVWNPLSAQWLTTDLMKVRKDLGEGMR